MKVIEQGKCSVINERTSQNRVKKYGKSRISIQINTKLKQDKERRKKQQRQKEIRKQRKRKLERQRQRQRKKEKDLQREKYQRKLQKQRRKAKEQRYRQQKQRKRERQRQKEREREEARKRQKQIFERENLSPQHYIFVRQVLFLNVQPKNASQYRYHLKSYGPIQHIQINQNSVYIKFFTVQVAAKVCASYQQIKCLFKSKHFKIHYSNHFSRWDVISNHEDSQVQEELKPVLYVGLGKQLALKEQFLRQVFCEIGGIKNIYKKQFCDKVYVFAEFQNISHTLKARQAIKKRKISLWSNRKIETNILFDKQKVLKKYPELQHQINRQNRFQICIQGSSIMKEIFSKTNKDSVVWRGEWIMQQKKKVEMSLILSKEVHFSQSSLPKILKINHKSELQYISKTDYLFSGRFSAFPQKDKTFLSYATYFRSKKKSAIIFTDEYMILAFFKMENLPITFELKQNEAYALFFKNKD